MNCDIYLKNLLNYRKNLKKETVSKEDYPTLCNLKSMLYDAFKTYGNRPVRFILNGHVKIINDMVLSQHSEFYTLCCSGEPKYLTAEELYNMFQKAYLLYGDKPIKVNLENRQYIVDDLTFSVNGKFFDFVKKDFKLL